MENMENMEDILTGTSVILLIIVLLLVIAMVNITPRKMTDENCIYYQKDIYCRSEEVIWSPNMNYMQD